jgi:hypothetical protein
MRAQFIRGEDPKETMDIGRYRTDAPKKDLFLKMHAEASKSDTFGMVTPIRDEGKEPSFKIKSKKKSKFTKAMKDYEDDSFHNYTYIGPEEFTVYLTKDEGIILFDDNSDQEYPDISLKEFIKITSCR